MEAKEEKQKRFQAHLSRVLSEMQQMQLHWKSSNWMRQMRTGSSSGSFTFGARFS
jgi:hypothetical protein